MFRIITPDGTVFLTEKPNFIRMHTNSCFILTERNKAEGVAYGGVPYLFADGTQVHEYDGGNKFMEMDEDSAAIHEQLAMVDETAIELYEANLAQEEINAAQDDALIEIYEMIGG